MSLEGITLNQLHIFATICRLGSFTQAADTLNVAQPALSRQIKFLEERLGHILIDRSARPLQPTPAGARILSHANDVLNAAERLVNDARQQTRDNTRRLVIGFVGSALTSDLSAALRTLHAEMPELDISMQEMVSTDQVEALSSGLIHIGFGRVIFDSSEASQTVLRHEPLVAATARGSAFAAPNNGSLLQRLTQTKILSYPNTPSPNYADQVRAGLRAQNVVPKAFQIVADLHTALSLAEADMGVTIVPQSAARASQSGLVFEDLSALDLTSPITINRPQSGRRKSTQRLVEILELGRAQEPLNRV